MKDDFFQELSNTRPFLKMGFEGFAGCGKTWTASEIAIGLHHEIHSKKPIVVYDTERALKATKSKFDKAGIKVLVRESRSLADLSTTIDRCVEGASEILMIDSITHVWETFIENYRKEKNRKFIEMLDWTILKPKWKREFSDRLVQSNIHIIFTGRAGFEYEQQINESTGKKEMVKSGIKMKVENETEYEPDIVVLMEKEKIMDGNSMKLKRKACIIKDRTSLIDGMEFYNPTYNDFKPAIDLLLDGIVSTAAFNESTDRFDDYDDNGHDKAKLNRKIYLEEIEGCFTQIAPGSSTKDKLFKMDVSEIVFNTRSWKAIEVMNLEQLEDGKYKMIAFKDAFREYQKSQEEQGLDVVYADAINLLYKTERETPGNTQQHTPSTPAEEPETEKPAGTESGSTSRLSMVEMNDIQKWMNDKGLDLAKLSVLIGRKDIPKSLNDLSAEDIERLKVIRTESERAKKGGAK